MTPLTELAQVALDFVIAAMVIGLAIWLCFCIPDRDSQLGSNTD